MYKFLTETKVRTAKPKAKPYKLYDSGGMYCLVDVKGGKYWRQDYRYAGRRRTLALGVWPDVTLAEARRKRDEARVLLARGEDPGAAKKAARRAVKLSAENTFEAVAREWLLAQKNRLSPAYAAQVLSRLEADIFPAIGARPIDQIEPPELLAPLSKAEQRGVYETVRRLRQTCGKIFRHAIAKGRAQRDPSADLSDALHARPPVKHFASMPLEHLPDFARKVSTYDGEPRTAIALRLMLLTFARTKTLRFAKWAEFEFDSPHPVWRAPAPNMKGKVEHLIPLAPQTVALLNSLRAMPGATSTPYLFPSRSKHGCMSNNTMLTAMYRMGYKGIATVHGFRTVASTILNEAGFRRDAIERQLSHQEKDKVRAAYNRAEYLEERRALMVWWANYIDSLADEGKVIVGPFRSHQR